MTHCRSCDSLDVSFLGELPDCWEFAGRTTKAILSGGALWQCRRCDFKFRAPILSTADYSELYRGGALDVWTDGGNREDFRLIREYLEKFESERLRVLDFGCYSGHLLATMPKSFDLFGIEPNQEAAQAAGQKGVTIIPTPITDETPELAPFDIIILCDVIEHVPSPEALVLQLHRWLKKGGLLIVSTGNANAWLWRLTKARFWYGHFPEHISFISLRWLDRVVRPGHYKLVRYEEFNYRGNGLNLLKLIAVLIFWRSPRFYRWLRLFASPKRNSVPTPGIGATRDHFLFVLERS